MALEAQNNPFTSILMVEAADPEAIGDADPSAGQRRLVVGTDHLLYVLDDSGVKHSVSGSGLTDPMTTRGDIIVRNASNVTARLPIGSTGKVLSSDGTDISWQTPSAAGMATDALWDAAGDLAQGTGSNTGAKLTIGSSGDVLTVVAGSAAWGKRGARHGASVWHNTTQTINNSVILYNTENFDTDAYHSTSSNTSRMTIPSGLGGLYLAIVSGQDQTGACGVLFTLNGAAIANGGHGHTTTPFSGSVIIPLAAGDYLETLLDTSSANHTLYGVGGDSWQGAHFSISLLSD